MVVMVLADGIITVLSLREHQQQVSGRHCHLSIVRLIVRLELSLERTSEDSLLCHDHPFDSLRK